MSREDPQAFVELSAELADDPSALGNCLLLPAVRNGTEQGDQRGRRGGKDAGLDPGFEE